tara:strand:- start:306 stop:587 length:282 start_codon:yes stop_codon:yes gene_type:complete
MNLEHLIASEDGLSIFVWAQQDEESFVDAFKNFPPGKKSRLKKEVRRLEEAGQKIFEAYLLELCDDDLWIDQTLAEIGPANLLFIAENYKNGR